MRGKEMRYEGSRRQVQYKWVWGGITWVAWERARDENALKNNNTSRMAEEESRVLPRRRGTLWEQHLNSDFSLYQQRPQKWALLQIE